MLVACRFAALQQGLNACEKCFVCRSAQKGSGMLQAKKAGALLGNDYPWQLLYRASRLLQVSRCRYC